MHSVQYFKQAGGGLPPPPPAKPRRGARRPWRPRAPRRGPLHGVSHGGARVAKMAGHHLRHRKQAGGRCQNPPVG